MKQLVAVALGIGAMVAAVPACADSVQGKVVAYDRVAHRLVLADKTIYSLKAKPDAAPAELSAGDLVRVEFTSPGDDGISSIDVVTVIEDTE